MVQRVWVNEGVGSFLVGDVILSIISVSVSMLMPQNVALFGWLCHMWLQISSMSSFWDFGPDKHMATLIKHRFGSTEQLKVIEEDITKFHIRSHFPPFMEEKYHATTKLAKVVSNLPFNVSTEVVKLLLPMGDVFSVVVLMLQDETAVRLADTSIQIPEYRPINVFVNFYSKPEYKFRVDRENFFPRPKVDGAVISFKLKNEEEYPPVSSPKGFFSMVNSAFMGKRKMLRKSLQHICSSSEIEAALDNIGLPVTARPSDLVLDDFVRLHNHLQNHLAKV